VVGAEKAPGFAFLLDGDLGAPVTAHVDKGSDHSLAVSDQENGDTRDFERPIAMGLREFRREGEEKWQAAENSIDFELPALGVAVVGSGDVVDSRCLVHCPRHGVGNMTTSYFDQATAAH